MQYARLAPALGAVVTDIDLREPLSAALVAELDAALSEHQVLFFVEQDIEPAHHRALAAAFGPPVLHPAYPTVAGYEELTILESTPEKPTKIDTWHTDMTFLQAPPLGSILRARVVPEVGGDTMWASGFAAYESLSSRMRDSLCGLVAVHSFSHGFRHSLAEPGGWERLEDAVRRNPPVRHPVVRAHPKTGRPALFVNRLFTTHVEGISSRESDTLLAFLFDHYELPEHTCRFRWRPNAIAFWDNRSTQHRPINDYFPARRKMERITIAGDVPQGS